MTNEPLAGEFATAKEAELSIALVEARRNVAELLKALKTIANRHDRDAHLSWIASQAIAKAT